MVFTATWRRDVASFTGRGVNEPFWRSGRRATFVRAGKGLLRYQGLSCHSQIRRRDRMIDRERRERDYIPEHTREYQHLRNSGSKLTLNMTWLQAPTRNEAILDV
eukprot:sb/3477933/